MNLFSITYRTIIVISLVLSCTFSFAQLPVKGYLLFPIKPGQVNYLSANMGELRPNHFHAGIDIKTDFTTGLPVYAAQDGYISRIRISSYGYGNTLYITHPNGLVTVYAHLERFSADIQNYVISFQYANETFELDHYLPKGQLNVKRGDVVAKSGNSGSSGGPHLHFEIRDSLEHVLNPLQFGFTEIKDSQTPIFQKIAVKPLNINARVQNEFALKEWTASKKTDGTYGIPATIEAYGSVGLEIKVHDRMNETSNSYGVNCIELFVNGEEVFYHNIETFAFDESKYINVHIDYEHFISRRQRLERCYIADGNKLSTHKQIRNQGRLTITPGETKNIEIRIYDTYGNKSILKCTLKGVKPDDKPTSTSAVSAGSRVDENTLYIACPAQPAEQATLFMKGKAQALIPSYRLHAMNIYLYDLRKGLPDSIQCLTYKESFNFKTTIPPGKNFTYTSENLTIGFADTTLFDTLYLQVKNHVIKDGQEVFEISSPATPIFGKVNVKFCPQHEDNKSEQCYFYSVNGTNNHRFEGGEWNDADILYDIKYLGKFTVRRDIAAPQIVTKKASSSKVEFTVHDLQSGIKSFRAELNGKWVLMHYDHKTAKMWSEMQVPGEKLKGKFTLEVTDKSLNSKTITLNIP